MRNILVAALLLLGPAALAEGEHHHGHATPAAQSSETAATRALRDAYMRMHQDMAIAYANDVDIDFLRGMIPHHAGAIATAKITLAHSTDPEVRKLAEDIVKAQESEIAQMQAMLKQREAAAAR